MSSAQVPQLTTEQDLDSTDVSSGTDHHTPQTEQCFRHADLDAVDLDWLETSLEKRHAKFNDPARRENDLEYDLLTTDWILQKTRDSDAYAQNLYAALCNNQFQRQEVMPVLRDQRWSCSWRYAGGIIADMRQQGDYMDWYCSGLRGGDEPDVYTLPLDLGYVNESVVTDQIRQDLATLGWSVCEDYQSRR